MFAGRVAPLALSQKSSLGAKPSWTNCEALRQNRPSYFGLRRRRFLLSDNPFWHGPAFVASGASTVTLLGKLVQGMPMHTYAKPQGMQRSMASACNELTETRDVDKIYAPS